MSMSEQTSPPSDQPTPPGVLQLPVAAVRHETPSVVTVSFHPEQAFDYRPGQHVMLRVPDVEDPEGDSREFTLSSSPTETGRLSITTRLDGSPLKTRLVGEPRPEVELTGPMGSFVLDESRPAIMLAGGIGVTPFRSMMRYAADKALEIPMRLLYSNRVPEEIVFRDEFAEIARLTERRIRVLHTVSREAPGWPGRTGHIDPMLVRQAMAGLQEPLFYVCGSERFEQAMRRLLTEEMDVEAGRIRSENFPGY